MYETNIMSTSKMCIANVQLKLGRIRGHLYITPKNRVEADHIDLINTCYRIIVTIMQVSYDQKLYDVFVAERNNN